MNNILRVKTIRYKLYCQKTGQAVNNPTSLRKFIEYDNSVQIYGVIKNG